VDSKVAKAIVDDVLAQVSHELLPYYLTSTASEDVFQLFFPSKGRYVGLLAVSDKELKYSPEQRNRIYWKTKVSLMDPEAFARIANAVAAKL